MNKKLQPALAIVGIFIAGLALYAPIRYFATKPAEPLTAAVGYSLPEIDELESMTVSELFDVLIANNLLTTSKRDEFLDEVTFDRVFNLLTPEQTLQLLFENDMVTDNSLAALENRVESFDINLNKLKASAVLTALIAPDGHYNEILTDTPRNLYTALKATFNLDKTSFLNILSKNYILFMLDGERRTAASDDEKDILAYAWSDPAEQYSNLVYMPRALREVAVGVTAQYVNAQPAGARTLLAWHFMEPNVYPADGVTTSEEVRSLYDIRDPNGALREFDGIWLDEWAARTKQNYLTYFAALHAAGADVDIFAGDEEAGWFPYGIVRNNQSRFTTPTGQTVWQEIYEDPRWEAVADRIGIDADEILTATTWPEETQRRFNAIMSTLRAEKFEEAFVDALLTYYPDAVFNNFGMGYANHVLTKDWGSAVFWRVGLEHASIAQSSRDSWTSASFGGYSYFEPFAYYPNETLPILTPPNPAQPQGCIDANATTFRTAYHGLMWDLVAVRQQATSVDQRGYGWIPFSSYRDGAFGPGSRVLTVGSCVIWEPGGTGDTLFGERIFHNVMSNAEAFLNWNPADFGVPESDNEYLNDLLQEVTEMAGYDNRYPLAFSPIENDDFALNLNDNYILSGMEVAGVRLYRFTPRLGDSSLVNPSFSIGDVLEDANTATFNLIDGSTVTIPGGRVVYSSSEHSDHQGFWVVVDYESYLQNDLSTTVTLLDAVLNPGDSGGDDGDGGGGGGGSSNSFSMSFSATPKQITAGSNVTFKWNASTATGCTASGGWAGNLPKSGAITQKITKTETYVLKCRKNSRLTSKSVKVTVVPGAPVGGDLEGAGTLPTSTVRIKAVGTNYSIDTAPEGLNFSLDNQLLAAGPLVMVLDVPVGTRLVSAPDNLDYSETYGTCFYPQNGAECYVPAASLLTPMTCIDGTCKAPIEVKENFVTKIAVLYTKGAGTQLISGVGAIKIKHVGANEYPTTAPAAASANIDAGASTAQNPSLFSNMTAGAHTVNALNFANYTEYYGSCEYTGTAECFITTYTKLTCTTTSCALPVIVTAGKTRKVVFKYVSNTAPVTPPKPVTPPAPPVPTPPTPPTPPTTPTPPVTPPVPPTTTPSFSVSCLPFPSTVTVGDSVVWKAYPVPAGAYTYSWSGTDNLAGSAVSVSKIYTKPGTKTATVLVNGVSRACNKPATVSE